MKMKMMMMVMNKFLEDYLYNFPMELNLGFAIFPPWSVLLHAEANANIIQVLGLVKLWAFHWLIKITKTHLLRSITTIYKKKTHHSFGLKHQEARNRSKVFFFFLFPMGRSKVSFSYILSATRHKRYR